MINGRPYALKVVRLPPRQIFTPKTGFGAHAQFKYHDNADDLGGLDDDEPGFDFRDILNAHMDPFYHECRAFGRIIAAGLNGKIAARWYGYTTVPAKMEEELEPRFGVIGWGRPQKEYAKPSNERQRFRAIRMDLVLDHDVPCTEKLLKKIPRDLKRMQRLGMHPMVIRARNYASGFIGRYEDGDGRSHIPCLVSNHSGK